MSLTLEPLLPNCFYHVYNHANGSDNLFNNDANYFFFLEKYKQYILPIADTFAYCLMPNHFHLFVRFKPLQGLQTLEGVSEDKYYSQQFSNMFNGYTQAYNKMFDRKGSLFNPRFKRKKVDTTDYFIQLIKYIHLNPVTHGFAKHPDDWKFSSWHSYITSSPSKIKCEEALQWFADLQNFKSLHQSPVSGKFILDMEL